MAFETHAAYNYNHNTGNDDATVGAASATMASVDYTFLEQSAPASVPEPSGIVLLATVLPLLVWRALSACRVS